MNKKRSQPIDDRDPKRLKGTHISSEYTDDQKIKDKKMYTRWINRRFDYEFDKDSDGKTAHDKELEYRNKDDEYLRNNYKKIRTHLTKAGLYNNTVDKRLIKYYNKDLKEINEESEYDADNAYLANSDLENLFSRIKSRKSRKSKKSKKSRKSKKPRKSRKSRKNYK